jgi:TonB-dependent receptor
MLQNTIAHTTNDLTAFKYGMNFTVRNGLTYQIQRDKNNKEILINALQTEYNFGPVKAEFTLSHSYSDKTTDIRYGDPGDNFQFVNSTGKPHPYGYYPDSSNVVDWYMTHRPTLTPDDVYKIQIDPTDAAAAQIDAWATTRGESFKEHLYNSTLDFTVPVSLSEDLSAKIKVGGKFSRSTRENILVEKYKRTGDLDFYNAVANFFPGKVLTNTNPLMLSDVMNNDYTRGQYFLESTYPIKYVVDPGIMDQFLPLSASVWTPGIHKANSTRYNFNGAEIFSAGYLMGDFSIGSAITLLGGVRFEHYNMKYKANFVYVTHAVDGLANLYDTLNTVDRNDDILLPNVQLRIKPTDFVDIRLAYTNTLARPDYQAIMPNVYLDPGSSAQAGNPKLKPTVSKNYDVYVSLYSNEIGLFTVGGFYKRLDNVFFSTNIFYQNLSHYDAAYPDSAAWLSLTVQPPAGSLQISTFVNNPHPAYLKGLELEWQTNFWYLPRPLNYLVFNINYTRTWSEMDYQQLRNNAISHQEGRFIIYDYVTTDTIRTARLLNQSDHVLNVALGIDYLGFSGRVSFNLQSNVITSVGSRPEEDQFTGNIYRWDLTLHQKLPIEGLSVSFDVQNLTHSPIKTYRKFRRTPTGDILDNLTTTIYGPAFYQLSLRYSI